MATNGIRKINEWLMNAEQLADKQVETAKRAASPYAEESIKSEIIAINRLKDEYLKAGDDETTALEKAKNERIAILEQELSKQQSLRNKSIMRTSSYGKIWEMLHSSNRRLDWKRQMPNSARNRQKPGMNIWIK